MKIWVIALTIIGFLFGMFWVIAPALMKDKVIGLITFGNTDRQCFNYYKNEKDYFINPDSAYIESSRILPKSTTYKDEYPFNLEYMLKDEEYDSIIEVKVFAHNSMGGYVSDTINCPLNGNNFSKSNTDKYLLDKYHRESTIKTCEKKREKWKASTSLIQFNDIILDDFFTKHCRTKEDACAEYRYNNMDKSKPDLYMRVCPE